MDKIKNLLLATTALAVFVTGVPALAHDDHNPPTQSQIQHSNYLDQHFYPVLAALLSSAVLTPDYQETMQAKTLEERNLHLKAKCDHLAPLIFEEPDILQAACVYLSVRFHIDPDQARSHWQNDGTLVFSGEELTKIQKTADMFYLMAKSHGLDFEEGVVCLLSAGEVAASQSYLQIKPDTARPSDEAFINYVMPLAGMLAMQSDDIMAELYVGYYLGFQPEKLPAVQFNAFGQNSRDVTVAALMTAAAEISNRR